MNHHWTLRQITTLRVDPTGGACRYLLGIAIVIIAMGGCGDDDSSVTDPPVTSDFGLIVGTTTDVVGTALSDVMIRAGSQTTTSNSQGYFVISDLAATERVVVEFEKNGYASTYAIAQVRGGATSDVVAVLKAVDTSTEIDAAAGGIVSGGANCSVDLEGGSLVDDTGFGFGGTATVGLTTFNPTVFAEQQATPGVFLGRTVNDVELPLSSFSVVDVTIDSPNGELDLGDGRTATIVMPIASSLLVTAPQTIALWYFDPSAGLWREDGHATRVGDAYEGSVGHFTTWMAADGMGESYHVTGRVVGVTGDPVLGARVTVTGANFQHSLPSTPEDGTFDIETVCATATVQASVGEQTSNTVNISCEGSGGTDVGDLLLSVPYVTITLSWGSEPRDLDLHLAIPSEGGWTHLYYPSRGTWVEGALLNTDDTTSFGPEIITVIQLHDGVYRASVHHYAGEGTIASSEASAFLTVRDLGVFPLEPPSGATAAKDVWRMWDITVTGGKVTQVSLINDYLHGVDAGDLGSFTP